MARVLILGGTRDAVDLAGAASALAGIEVIYSLAGVTRNPNLPDCEIRSGGFGGAEGLRKYLADARIDAVIDATHPFAAKITANAAAACGGENIPRLKYLRPPWRPAPGDNWIEVSSSKDAALFLADHPGTAFLTTGTRQLSAFAGLTDCRFVVRYIHAPKDGAPLENCEVVVSRGPFDEEGETALMRSHGIDVLVCKNSGGDAAAAKLGAARALTIPVIMIARPPPPDSEIAETEAAAIAWLRENI
ncbi:MAG: cobalt-precorrin-6A reductase [Rhodospirillaceae bacterium]|jgi:precorrin-6A/cobalt-precorrin-6A reductase|nr:cobalt-precorrin-6A reductase [Rhodospirillaceae bacterium]MDP6645603.1 cobalt-precorrin-6A reductase [Rhodospirillales bacterium]|tara:strand:- start:959 stop:1699 length:741 start_codon:yes stop_codon:yes gene_type:complete